MDTLGGDNMERIGERIREARLASGLTQQQLGDMVGVQKSAIAKYESGRVVNIKRDVLMKMTEALDIGLYKLVGIEETAENTADLHTRILLDLDLMSSIKNYYSLSESNRTIIRTLIDELAKVLP